MGLARRARQGPPPTGARRGDGKQSVRAQARLYKSATQLQKSNPTKWKCAKLTRMQLGHKLLSIEKTERGFHVEKLLPNSLTPG